MTINAPVAQILTEPADPLDEDGSVPVRVAKAIQQMIADRGLKADDPLPSQRQLASLLQVSRPSVREGISMLETLGLIRVEKRRGLFVGAPSDRPPSDFWTFEKGYDLKSVFQFRANLEPEALRLAFPFLNTGALARLRAHAEDLHEAARLGNAVIAAEKDTAFHDVFFDACPNRIFKDIRQHLEKAMQNSQWVPMIIIDRVHDTAREHYQIVEALEAGDCEAACLALRHHISAAARRCDLDINT